MSYVEIQNLSKKFGNNIILDQISLEVNKGDVVAIIGPSGTGKSTFLRCLNLLEKPESGDISFDGNKFDLTDKSRKRQKTALENVMEGLIVVKKKSREEARKIAEEQLFKVGMSDRKNHYPVHLSGGQQQRVAIARALAMEPELLLMDEPTSALDPELVGEVLNTIKKVSQEGNTILLVTHEMNFVKSAANRVIFLENGKIIEQGTPREIFGHPSSKRLQDFLIQINMLSNVEYVI